jgi:hypothetical protein
VDQSWLASCAAAVASFASTAICSGAVSFSSFFLRLSGNIRVIAALKAALSSVPPSPLAPKSLSRCETQPILSCLKEMDSSLDERCLLARRCRVFHRWLVGNDSSQS